MQKSEELRNPASCLNKAGADEPLFVLRANDPTAPQTVRLWATMNEGIQPEGKIAEARSCADKMEAWRVSRPQPAEQA